MCVSTIPERESFKISFETPRQKLLTLFCVSRSNKTVAFLSFYYLSNVFLMIYINAYIVSKCNCTAKDFSSIYEV